MKRRVLPSVKPGRVSRARIRAAVKKVRQEREAK